MRENDDIRIYNRELNRNNNKKKVKETKNIIKTSIKRQFFVFLSMLLTIITITSMLNVIGKKTSGKIANISQEISSTGKIKASNFVTINEDGGYYELDIDKAYEELEEWANKNGINLRTMGLTKEIYGEMLKLEAGANLVSLGGTPVGENAVQGKIVLYRKKSDGTIIPMSYMKKAQWDQNIITKRINEISGLGIGATKASETDDMITEESKRIWMALKTNGWSNMAIIGAMGNMYVESKYSSEKTEGKSNQESTEYTTIINKKEEEKENYINDGKGYGLIQWRTKEDKEELYNLSKRNQVSIGDFAMQLKYMQSQAEKSEKMKLFIEGKNTEGKEITETEYAVTAFYEYWIKKNYEFEEKATSDEERNKDELATRWKAGEEIEEEYVYNQRLGKKQIIGQQRIASSNKFLGINNNKNNIKVADAITRTQIARNPEEKEKLDKYYEENIQPTFTVDNGKVVVGSLYTVEIRIFESDFAKEEESINKILDGAEDGSDINGGGDLAYQMEVREQTIDVSEVPSNANLSAATVASMLITTPGDKTKDELQKKFGILLEDAQRSQGTEVGIQDFTTVVTTTQTEEMNLKFEYEWYRKSKEGEGEEKGEEQDQKGTDEQEFKTTVGNTEYILDRDILHGTVKVDDVGYRTIRTTEITTIPQAVVEKQKTIGKEVTYVYEENQEHEKNEATKIEFSDTDSEYTGWVECNKGGEGTQNSKVHKDYHKYLDSLGIDTSKEAEEEHKHLTQTATGRSVRKQIDTSRSIYMKVGESVVTNNANALVTYIKEAEPDEEMLRDYLKDAGVKEEEIDEVVDALKKAKEEDKEDKEEDKDNDKNEYVSTGSNTSGTGGYSGNSGSSESSGSSSDTGSQSDKKSSKSNKKSKKSDKEQDSTESNSDSEKVKIEFTLTNKLAKAAYDYIKKGIKYVENGEDLKTGVNNPQFVYQLLKTETQMYTGKYVDLKNWSTKLENYIIGNDINLAKEGDVIIYKRIKDDNDYKVCIYAGKDNIIMEVDTTGGTTKKLDLSKYIVDRIYRFNEDGNEPEYDENVPRLVILEPIEITLKQNDTYQLKATLYPTTAKESTTLKWSTSNENQVSVNETGLITAKGPEETVITVETENNKKATCTVNGNVAGKVKLHGGVEKSEKEDENLYYFMIDSFYYNTGYITAEIAEDANFTKKDLVWKIENPKLSNKEIKDIVVFTNNKDLKVEGVGKIGLKGTGFDDTGETNLNLYVRNMLVTTVKLKILGSSKVNYPGKDVFQKDEFTSAIFYLTKDYSTNSKEIKRLSWGKEYVEAYINNIAKLIKDNQDNKDSKYHSQAIKKTVWGRIQNDLKVSYDSKNKKMYVSGTNYGFQSGMVVPSYEISKVKRKGELSPNNYLILFTSKNQWLYLLKKEKNDEKKDWDEDTNRWVLVNSKMSSAGCYRNIKETYTFNKYISKGGLSMRYADWGEVEKGDLVGKGAGWYAHLLHSAVVPGYVYNVYGRPTSHGCIHVGGYSDQNADLYYQIMEEASVCTRVISE